MYILGIESSCDETSVSIVEDGTKEIATIISSQIPIHKLYGGVIPEMASREHVTNITLVIEECLKKAKMNIEDIDKIAVTYGPGLVGSLLVGIEAAKTLALVHNKPLIKVHHILGHIYANSLNKSLQFPLLALIASGGHTDLIHMKNHNDYERLGSTLDDAIGEAYDKVARVIGLPYPGGPLLDKLSKEGKDTYDLPIPLDDESYNFSFSGIKSSVLNLINKEKMKNRKIRDKDLAASFQNRVIGILVKKTIKALKEKEVNNLIVAGGVAANNKLREDLKNLSKLEKFNLTIPEKKYCTDNATMIAAAAYFNQKETDFSFSAISVEKL